MKKECDIPDDNMKLALRTKIVCKDEYATLDFINDMIDEITKISPSELIKISGPSKGKVPKSWISKNIFNKAGDFLKKVGQWIKNPNSNNYNPDYKFAEEILEDVKTNLERFEKELYTNGEKCFKLVEKYSKINDLKKTSHQQWHIHNPDLNIKFFNDINEASAYWAGFLGSDGYIAKGYSIGISLSAKDDSQLRRFCDSLGLGYEKIKYYDKIYRGKTYKMCRITLGVVDITNALKELKFKELPSFFNEIEDAPNDPVALSWLLGRYDGDGQQGKTVLYSSNKDLLENIRDRFNIKNTVKKTKEKAILRHDDGTPKLDGNGNVMRSKGLYALWLSPVIFNKMMESYKGSMPRKRQTFDERINAEGKLKDFFENNKELLQELIDTLPTTHIISSLRKVLGVSREALYNLIEEWDIKIPPTGYWNSHEGKLRKNYGPPSWFLCKLNK